MPKSPEERLFNSEGLTERPEHGIEEVTISLDLTINKGLANERRGHPFRVSEEDQEGEFNTLMLVLTAALESQNHTLKLVKETTASKFGKPSEELQQAEIAYNERAVRNLESLRGKLIGASGG